MGRPARAGITRQLGGIGMATYCIGDLHACYDEFRALLDAIGFDPASDRIYLSGDVIGRGPQPVETLDFLLSHRGSITTVLGNHDLNLLALASGCGLPRPRDNLQPLLDSPQLEEYCAYLRRSPLMIISDEPRFVLLHAGLYPLWSIARACERTALIEEMLRDDERCRELLGAMYGATPEHDDPGLEGPQLWRFVLNACTRMRFIYPDGRLELRTSAMRPSQMQGSGLLAWYDHPQLQVSHQGRDYALVFGHWAALQGECHRPGVVAVDTGCVWGGRLTCWCADSARLQWIDSPGYRSHAG